MKYLVIYSKNNKIIKRETDNIDQAVLYCNDIKNTPIKLMMSVRNNDTMTLHCFEISSFKITTSIYDKILSKFKSDKEVLVSSKI